MNGLLKEKKTVIALGAVGAVVVLAAAWFLVVAPQQSKADDLGAQVTEAQNELAQRRPSSPPPQPRSPSRPPIRIGWRRRFPTRRTWRA